MPDAPAPKTTDQIFVDIAIAAVAFLLLMALLKSLLAWLFGGSGDIVGGYVNTVGWFYTDWMLKFTIAAFIIGILDALLIAAAIGIIKRYNNLRREIAAEEQQIVTPLMSPEEEFNQNWQNIRNLMESGNASDWNMAILRADAQLDDTLLHLGYEGETIADRLRIVDPTKLQSVDRIWSAHRLRNAIAHDPLQLYTREMITHALESYEIAFKELGLLRAAPPVPESMQESMPIT